MTLANRTLLVTGANRGLGKAIVEASLARGAQRVYAGARNPDTLAELVKAAEGRVVPIQLDVTQPASLERAAAQAQDVDMLVNNAGLLASYSVLSATFADIQRDLDTNFLGLVATTRAFLPALERAAKSQRPAALVNILSVASLASVPPIAMYSASKAAAFSATQALRVELAPKNIRVHGVLAGAIDTDMVKHMEMPKTSPADLANNLLEAVAAGQDDIAPDPISQSVVGQWLRDPKEAERQLGAM